MPATLPAPKTPELKRLTDLAPEVAVREAAIVLVHLAMDPAFLNVHVFPLLEEAKRSDGWYVARAYDAPDRSYSLQVFVWPPGTGTQVHDHTTWGAYCCVAGCVMEERYERLDDGSRLDYARLRKIWQLKWTREDGVSTVLPYDGGIHRVGNPGTKTAISVHLYGPQLAEVDGRDYDPLRDYVCDRFET